MDAKATATRASATVAAESARRSGPPQAGPMVALQRSLGNRVLGAVIQRCANGRPCAECAAAAREQESRSVLGSRPVDLQRLTVGAPDDAFEREADQVAERVMRMPAQTVQRKCASCEEEEERLHRKPREAVATPSAAGAGEPVPAAVQGAIESSSAQPLDGAARAYFEPRFGMDFTGVRVHADALAAQAATGVQARAFTLGSGIYFGSGEYRPNSDAGRRLLAHELTHVIQQSSLASLRRIQRTVAAANVDCNPPAAADVPVVGANPLATIRAADRRAIDVLTTAHDTLELQRNRVLAGEPPAWPTIGDRDAEGLRRILHINPDTAANWTGTGPGSVFIVMRRLEIVRNLLRSGTIHYHCRSSVAGACGFGCGAPCCPGLTRGSSCFGIFHNFLCDNWWAAGARARASTIMHEPFHMSFSFVGDAGRLANAHCYARLAFWINGEDSPADLHARCPM